jgi:hypothetical protein
MGEGPAAGGTTAAGASGSDSGVGVDVRRRTDLRREKSFILFYRESLYEL